MKKYTFALLLSFIATARVSAVEPVQITAPNSTAPSSASAIQVSNPADETPKSTPAYKNFKAFYASIDAGMIIYNNANSTYDNGALPNPGLLGVGAGYRFNRYVGIEANYSVVANSSLRATNSVVLTEKLTSSALDFAAVGTYPINDNTDIFVKLGVAYTRLQYNFSSPTFTPSTVTGSGSKSNLMFGIGAQNNYEKTYSIRIQYENFGNTPLTETLSTGTTKTVNIGNSVISVGGSYYF